MQKIGVFSNFSEQKIGNFHKQKIGIFEYFYKKLWNKSVVLTIYLVYLSSTVELSQKSAQLKDLLEIFSATIFERSDFF
jgi:hypothetical protein